MADSSNPVAQDPSKLKISGPKVPEAPVKRPVKWTTVAAGIFLAVFSLAGFALIRQQANQNVADRKSQLQTEMNLILESRATDVEQWLKAQFDVLREIATNESQKIYIDALLDPNTPTDRREGAETFLRNYLKRMAEDFDFVTPPRKLEIAANVVRDGIAGLAVVNPQGQVLVGSEFVPALREDKFLDILQKNSARQHGLWNLHLDRESQPSMGFLLPIYPMDAKDNAKPIAFVVGIKQVAKELYPLLQQPNDPAKSAEIYLAQIKEGTGDGTVQYLSPRLLPKPNGIKPFSSDEPNDSKSRATAFAISKPGGFGILPSYQNVQSVVGGMKIDGTPWTLVRTADFSETVGPAIREQRRDLISFGLLLGIAVVSLVIAWKHGAELRAAVAAMLKFVSQMWPRSCRMLRVQCEFEYVLGHEAAGITTEEVTGKTMPAVIGPVRAAAYQKINKQVIDDLYPGWPSDRTEGKWQPQKVRHEFEEGGKKKYTKTDHIPLRADLDHPPGVLLIEQDITEFITERERRERMFRGLIEAFVKEVDSRQADSARTNGKLIAKLARGAAEEMGLTPIEIETAELAGELLNLGTVSLPQDLLAKGGNRNEDEKKRLREAVVRSADLLTGLEFEGPVAEVIRQSQERVDGSGFPNRLSGSAILPAAKVVAVAKRVIDLLQGQEGPAQSLDQALKIVMAEAGSSLDRGAVAALVDFLDNRGGRAKIGLF
ncbi:hypothetical protein EBX31_06400 [bacterium]|nr:hypothetical protein [bacterium]